MMRRRSSEGHHGKHAVCKDSAGRVLFFLFFSDMACLGYIRYLRFRLTLVFVPTSLNLIIGSGTREPAWPIIHFQWLPLTKHEHASARLQVGRHQRKHCFLLIDRGPKVDTASSRWGCPAIDSRGVASNHPVFSLNSGEYAVCGLPIDMQRLLRRGGGSYSYAQLRRCGS